MTLLALDSGAEGLTNRFAASSAHIGIKRNGVVEVPIKRQFLLPHIHAIRDGMVHITDDLVRCAHFPWHNFVFDAYGEYYRQEVGLRTPDKSQESERKFVFHYLEGMLPELRAVGVPLEEYAEFFAALASLSTWAMEVARVVARGFDEANHRDDELPSYYSGSMLERLEHGTVVIRVLRYLDKKDREPDAKIHIDRGLFSIHPWSSHEGLVFFNRKGSPVTVDETNPDYAAVFLGEKSAAVTCGMLGLGTPHGVRDVRRDSSLRDEDRFAIVCFVHPEARDDDVQWLLNNRMRIVHYENRFHL